jgi:inorganic phosphate transporter, PiT family
MTTLIILLAVICLAYANGANDNFKGVATLFGSQSLNYKKALAWATATTFLGSLTAVILAEKLLKSFSGKGLVAADIVNSASYGSAVALGAGLTVLLATRIGMPISTTHSLVGALIGAGLAAGSDISYGNLSKGFVVPLLLSPILSVLMAVIIYPTLKWGRKKSGITEEACLCVGNETVEIIPVCTNSVALDRSQQLTIELGNTVSCQSRYQGKVMGLEASKTLDFLHYISAGMVSYARGLNDTPKIAALLLLVPQLSGWSSIVIVGVVIALGGLISARKVAETMGNKITSMNHGQGFTANFITGAIVIGASRFGLPVSTTHVSCGSLFGIGAVTRQAHWKMIGKILLAWITTLPMGAALGFAAFWVINQL